VSVVPNAGMDIQDIRRGALRSYLKETAHLSVNAFATKLERSASFFNELLKGKRPFREQLAETLERQIAEAGLPPLALRAPTPSDDNTLTNVVRIAERWPFSVARERFDQLSPIQKARIDERVCAMIEQFEAEPKPRRATKRR
jgi:hypothetical protein